MKNFLNVNSSPHIKHPDTTSGIMLDVIIALLPACVFGCILFSWYAVTVLLFLMIPLILGSLFAFLIFLAYPVVIAVRIRGEERILEKELAGYAEYKKRVKWRLIPLIW